MPSKEKSDNTESGSADVSTSYGYEIEFCPDFLNGCRTEGIEVFVDGKKVDFNNLSADGKMRGSVVELKCGSGMTYRLAVDPESNCAGYGVNQNFYGFSEFCTPIAIVLYGDVSFVSISEK